jgi:hypothetical protein
LRLDEAMRVVEVRPNDEIVVTETYAEYEFQALPDKEFAITYDDGPGYAFLHKAIFITKEVEAELKKMKAFTTALKAELKRGAGIFYEEDEDSDKPDFTDKNGIDHYVVDKITPIKGIVEDDEDDE